MTPGKLKYSLVYRQRGGFRQGGKVIAATFGIGKELQQRLSLEQIAKLFLRGGLLLKKFSATK
jgi:hypothetical protein